MKNTAGMKASIKSELRKLFSVRSTYFVSIIAIAFVVLLSWIVVWDMKNTVNVGVNDVTTSIGESAPEAAGEPVLDPEGKPIDEAAVLAEREQWLSTRQREVVMNSFSTVATFIVIIVILQIVHEYRYGTIIYTLTSRRSRTAVFISKNLVLLAFSVLMGLVAVAASLITYKIAYSYYGLELPAQELALGDSVLRGSLYMVAFSVFAAVIAFVSRSIALAIAAFLILPSTVEGLLGIWLKHNSVYLPFSSATQLVLYNSQGEGSLDFKHALITTSIYVVLLYALTWYLFLKRDAN